LQLSAAVLVLKAKQAASAAVQRKGELQPRFDMLTAQLAACETKQAALQLSAQAAAYAAAEAEVHALQADGQWHAAQEQSVLAAPLWRELQKSEQEARMLKEKTLRLGGERAEVSAALSGVNAAAEMDVVACRGTEQALEAARTLAELQVRHACAAGPAPRVAARF